MLDTLAMAGQLTGEYRKTFEIADMYSTGNGCSEKNRDERLMDLYDMLTEAEKEGKAVEKIIGKDIEQFCKDFFVDEIGKFGNFLVKAYNIARIVFVLSILDFVLTEEGDMWAVQVNVFPVVSGLVIGCALTVFYKYVLQPVIFKNKKMNPTIHALIILGVFVAAIIFSSIVWMDVEVYVNNFTALFISGGYILGYLMLRTIWRIRMYGKAFGIHKEEKQLKKEFNREMDRKETLQISAEVLVKEFKKKNAKNRKKGKPELTQQEFAEMIRRNEEKSKKINILLIVLLVVIPSVWEMLTNNVTDGLVYGATIAVVEIIIWYFFYKFTKEVFEAQKYILEECEKRKISILEYVNGNEDL
ncbi:MAG: hypothetical protein J6A92_03895 [Lachnospiraceae bacterium]|nr:hypothetical protein [Lachnospiraceae bacterium]